MTNPTSVPQTAAEIAERLSDLSAIDQRWPRSSLLNGAAGIALLHVVRAHIGDGPRLVAHSWVAAAAHGEIAATDTTGLHVGAPALAYLMHLVGPDRYSQARAVLDRHVIDLVHRRVRQAEARIDRCELPRFTEYDLLHGLTGLGAHLLLTAPGSEALAAILGYLVRLTRPLRIDGETLPGWWVNHEPDVSLAGRFPGGHGNFGIAHGITGPLALCATAIRNGVTVEGQADAVETITDWLNAWQQDNGTAQWWPEWINRAQLGTGRADQQGPGRPSWCYGTPGIARALQLAAIATHDSIAQRNAERSLAACVTDPNQVDRLTDGSLCHGWAGLRQTLHRAAEDATTDDLTAALCLLTHQLAQVDAGLGGTPGLLTGEAGYALVALTRPGNDEPRWDRFMLIS